jgi:hypothetical protein
MADDRSQARREAAILLGVDIEHLSPADSLRVDMISSLRLVIDAEQATVLSGGSADLAKLNIAVQSLIGLLPGKELPAPPVNREDPRDYMWRTYSEARRRGEIVNAVMEAREIDRLRARVAELEAALEPTATPPAPAAPAPADNVVKLRDNPGRLDAAPAPVPQPLLRGPDEPWRAFYGDNSRWEV